MTNEFEQLLKECLELHNKKAHDYAQEGDKYSNFKRAAEIVSWFKNPIDQVFACMIGIKMARQAELRNGKVPNNESSRDTGLDLVNYAALWQSYYDSLVREPITLFGIPVKEDNSIPSNIIGLSISKRFDLITHEVRRYEDAGVLWCKTCDSFFANEVKHTEWVTRNDNF